MVTEASRRALEGLRDPTTLQWYVIPLLAIVFYVYVIEIKRARETGEWNAVFAGLTVFGMDFVNETVNGWILVLSDRSALWTAPGPTALRTMVGWNIEIMFMFALSGIIYFHTLGAHRRSRWVWAVVYSAFCVAVELLLERGGLLVWEYGFWNASFAGVWLIFLFGYFHFYVAAALVIGARRTRPKLVALAVMYGVAIALNVIGLGVLGWTY
ncbi:MAG: hypothetical protein F9K40_13540 [Kofleriaceae bacterium]|nr:MAG: hypothetical protein F9K40_13540 [Kofleriaceae bacterium]MBZ0234777.1 hypothetical protein [Kofleriaceae bacterium]